MSTPTLGYKHVAKNNLHDRSALDANPPFESFDVVHRRDYEAAVGELSGLREALRGVSNAYGCFAGCTGSLPGAPADGSGHTVACAAARAALDAVTATTEKEDDHALPDLHVTGPAPSPGGPARGGSAAVPGRVPQDGDLAEHAGADRGDGEAAGADPVTATTEERATLTGGGPCVACGRNPALGAGRADVRPDTGERMSARVEQFIDKFVWNRARCDDCGWLSKTAHADEDEAQMEAANHDCPLAAVPGEDTPAPTQENA